MGYDINEFRITMGIRKASDQILIQNSQEPKYEFTSEDELWASEMLDTIIEAISKFSSFASIYEFIFLNLLELEDWMHPDEKPITSSEKLSDLFSELNASVLAANAGMPYSWINKFSTTHTQVGVIAHFCHQVAKQNEDDVSDNKNDIVNSIIDENVAVEYDNSEFKLFKPLPSETSDEVMINEGIPIISSLFGTSEMAEHLGIALKNGHNGSINAHININAQFLNTGFQVSEEEAREMIEAWIKNINSRQFSSDQEVGYAFLSEVITKIVD